MSLLSLVVVVEPRLHCFKTDRDEIWQDSSSNTGKYASTVEVGFPI